LNGVERSFKLQAKQIEAHLFEPQTSVAASQLTGGEVRVAMGDFVASSLVDRWVCSSNAVAPSTLPEAATTVHARDEAKSRTVRDLIMPRVVEGEACAGLSEARLLAR